MADLQSAKDRLIVALDTPTLNEATRLVETLGDNVSFYKVGLELLFAGGLSYAQSLSEQGKSVFLDLKLLDIGNTVEHAVANATNLGIKFLTIHGHDMKTLNSAVSGRATSQMKLLAVTVLTSLDAGDLKQQGSTMSPSELVLRRAKMAHEAGFDGVIASGHEAENIRKFTGPDFLIVTPGIRLSGASTDDQARVMTPDRAITNGANYLVVGRPITGADDPASAAQTFTKHIAESLKQQS